MTGVRLAFERSTKLVSLSSIQPTRQLGRDIRKSHKFLTILASIRELGLVEPLAVHHEPGSQSEEPVYILLDGHLRLEALKVLGATDAVCLLSTDDEGYTERVNDFDTPGSAI